MPHDVRPITHRIRQSISKTKMMIIVNDNLYILRYFE